MRKRGEAEKVIQIGEKPWGGRQWRGRDNFLPTCSSCLTIWLFPLPFASSFPCPFDGTAPPRLLFSPPFPHMFVSSQSPVSNPPIHLHQPPVISPAPLCRGPPGSAMVTARLVQLASLRICFFLESALTTSKGNQPFSFASSQNENPVLIFVYLQQAWTVSRSETR